MQVSVPDHKILSRVALPARKTALLLSDMLVDFVSPKGKLTKSGGISFRKK